jgi:hypothetical protein
VTVLPAVGSVSMYHPEKPAPHRLVLGGDVTSSVPADPMKRTQVIVEMNIVWSHANPPIALTRRVESMFTVYVEHWVGRTAVVVVDAVVAVVVVAKDQATDIRLFLERSLFAFVSISSLSWQCIAPHSG